MKGDLEKLSFEFAVEILRLSKWLRESKEFIIADQIGRSGTSVGANIREARYAQSRSDFISKLSIALKETNETEYWLELSKETTNCDRIKLDQLIEKCNVIKVILISSVRTAKER